VRGRSSRPTDATLPQELADDRRGIRSGPVLPRHGRRGRAVTFDRIQHRVVRRQVAERHATSLSAQQPSPSWSFRRLQQISAADSEHQSLLSNCPYIGMARRKFIARRGSPVQRPGRQGLPSFQRDVDRRYDAVLWDVEYAHECFMSAKSSFCCSLSGHAASTPSKRPPASL